MNIIKKVISLLLCGVMLTLTCAGIGAEGLDLMLKINGRTIMLKNKPEVFEGVAYLPLRDIADRYGAKLEWQGEFSNIVIKTDTVTATVKPGSSAWYAGKEKRAAAAAAILSDGVTYLPCDMLDSIFGFRTSYDPAMKIIAVDTRAVNADGEADYMEIAASEDAYVQNGASSATNFGSEKSLAFKATTEADYGRLAYVKLDISAADRNFVKAFFRIYAYSGQSGAVTVKLYEIDPEAWSEGDITYDTQPQKGSEIASVDTTYGKYTSIDITDYIREKIKAGEEQISFALDGDYYQPLRLDFHSRENGKLVPCLYLTYTEDVEESSVITEFPVKDGFGKGEDPVLWAKKMVSGSTATGAYSEDMGSYRKTGEARIELTAKEAGFIRYGRYAGTNYSSQSTFECKNDPTSDNKRVAFLKFDLSEIGKENAELAYIDVYCENMSETKLDYITAYRVSDYDWTGATLAWYNAPVWGTGVDRCSLVGTGRWVRLDVTGLVNESIASDGVLSVALQESENVRVQFSGINSSNPPRLTVEYSSDAELARDNLEQHKSFVDVKASPSSSSWTKRATVLLEDLEGYDAAAEAPELDKYGGIIDGSSLEATGFFRSEKIDGRWWLVTPEGNRFVSIGLNGVSPGTSEGELLPIYSKYGTLDNWAQGTTDWLRNDLGFNTAGGFSRPQYLKAAQNQLCYTPIIYFITRYAELMGETAAQAGHAGFANNNAMPVFDPDWEDFCDSFAESETAEWKDSPYILGWISDNELPVEDDMLDRYLTLDYTDPVNAYSYATAWEWFRTKTGKEEPSMLDVTAELRDEWREFVYDRYYSVISAALKKHDPNHMYLGSRYMGRGYRSAGMLRAAGRYCDVVTINYYNAWTPDSILMNNWLEWSGKPVIITEWYAKGADSGMGNQSGAGWFVKTQSDRGRFYQNFAIGLMMSKACVGFHWFTYRDNDAASKINDASNTDSNKGVVDLNLKPYTGLVNDMAKINSRIYGIVDYLDRTYEE